MDTDNPSTNDRSRELSSCNAVTKYRSYVAVCDLTLGHSGEHQATLASAATYSWESEPW